MKTIIIALLIILVFSGYMAFTQGESFKKFSSVITENQQKSGTNNDIVVIIEEEDDE